MFPVHIWISVTDFRCDNFFPIKTALKYDRIVLFTNCFFLLTTSENGSRYGSWICKKGKLEGRFGLRMVDDPDKQFFSAGAY